MKRFCLIVFSACSGLAWTIVAAAQTSAAPQQPEAGPQAPETVVQPMEPDEPMQGGMMKKGMMKKDMKQSAEQKEKELEGQLKQEEQSMP